MLHAIEGAIGRGEKFFRGVAVLRVGGDAGAGGDGRCFGVGGKLFTDASDDASSNLSSGFGKHERKFVSTVAGGRINGAAMRAKNFSEAHDGATAGQVAILIVDSLQAIHVEKDDAERALSATRTIEFCFHYGEEAAVVGEAGERVADGHRVDLVEEARLVEQSAGKHDDITGGFGELGKNEGAVEKVPRKSSSDMTNDVENGDDKKRIVVEGGSVLVLLEPVTETERGDKKQRSGQQIPGPRDEGVRAGKRSRGSSEECRAGGVGGQGDDEESAGDFLAGLTSRGHIALDPKRRKKQNSQECAADHPAHRNAIEGERTALKQTVESEVADGLDHAGKYKAKGENQRGTVMGATKADKGVGGIAEAEKRATDFEVKIDLRVTKEIQMAEIEEKCEEDGRCGDTRRDQKPRRLPPENPDDLAPIAQEIPQIAAKTRDYLQQQANDRFCQKRWSSKSRQNKDLLTHHSVETG